MQGFNYHNDTKEFLSEVGLRIDLLETEKNSKDIYLLPNNCTKKLPNKNLNTNEINVYDETNKNWVIKKDFRKEEVFDINTKLKEKINHIGDLFDNLTTEKPFDNCMWDNINKKWIFDIVKAKQNKIELLEIKATSKIDSIYPWYKQLNAALGIYDSAKKTEITNYIKSIISIVDQKEIEINSKIEESTLDAVDITNCLEV